MMRLIITSLLGSIFGLGIALSGMASPAKVLNFFDVFGSWDPSLIFVMGGGLIVTTIGYRLVFKGRQKPLFDSSFHLPHAQSLDRQLIGGAALFGIGWGIAGFCPGGAIPALGLMMTEIFLFVIAMILGMLAARVLMAKAQNRRMAMGDIA